MATIKKAITGAVVAFATGVGTALADGQLELKEVLIAAGAALLSGAAVYQVKNAGQGPGGDGEGL